MLEKTAASEKSLVRTVFHGCRFTIMLRGWPKSDSAESIVVWPCLPKALNSTLRLPDLPAIKTDRDKEDCDEEMKGKM